MNNSWFSIDPVFPAWAFASGIIPLFTFFIWQEFHRKQKFLLFRIIANVLILISILGLLLQPSYTTEKMGYPILLLTKGYDKLKADSILKTNQKLKIITTKDAEPYLTSEQLTSYNDLTDIGDRIRIVMGEGLPAYALDLIDRENFSFIPQRAPIGITQLIVPKPILTNHLNSIHGIFNSSGKTKLKLVGPAGLEDSILLTARGLTSFTLSFTPRQSGLFLYRLVAQDSASAELSSTELTEKLPVEVTSERKLQILFLQKFPTAEVRQLKNYLIEQGHALALRYQTSKDIFKYEFANRSQIRIARLTPELLMSFDLVFVDSNVFGELSEPEKNQLYRSIHDGLGVIVLLNDIPEKGKTLDRFLQIGSRRTFSDTVHIRFSKSKLYTLPAFPVEITADPAIQPITQKGARILSGYRYSGFGKIGFQLLHETSRIRLEGNADDYVAVWSSLIEQTARAKNEMFKANLRTPFPYYTDEPLSVEIISSGVQPTLHSGRGLLPLVEDVVIDDLWLGKSWAEEAGWHHFQIKEDSTQLNYFVSANDDWKTLRTTNQLKENELLHMSNSEAYTTVKDYEARSVSSLLFYLLFLFSAALLWLTPKI